MKKLLSLLPLFAFVLGVGLAFGTQSESSALNIKKAFIGGNWVDINDQVVNEDYVCDTNPTQNCTAEFTPGGQMVPSTLIKGDYREL